MALGLTLAAASGPDLDELARRRQSMFEYVRAKADSGWFRGAEGSLAFVSFPIGRSDTMLVVCYTPDAAETPGLKRLKGEQLQVTRWDSSAGKYVKRWRLPFVHAASPKLPPGTLLRALYDMGKRCSSGPFLPDYRSAAWQLARKDLEQVEVRAEYEIQLHGDATELASVVNERNKTLEREDLEVVPSTGRKTIRWRVLPIEAEFMSSESTYSAMRKSPEAPTIEQAKLAIAGLSGSDHVRQLDFVHPEWGTITKNIKGSNRIRCRHDDADIKRILEFRNRGETSSDPWAELARYDKIKPTTGNRFLLGSTHNVPLNQGEEWFIRFGRGSGRWWVTEICVPMEGETNRTKSAIRLYPANHARLRGGLMAWGERG